MAKSDAAPVDTQIRNRKRRLWKLGFHCFTVAQNIDENLDPSKLDDALNSVFDADTSTVDLVYATLEFQMYTCWSPQLGVLVGGQLTASDANVRGYLDAELLSAAKPRDAMPSGAWGDVWERCLEIWEGSRDGQVYRCPILIELLKDVPDNPSEHTDLDSCGVGRANVWWFTREDRNQYFSAQDVSGWFNVDSTDSAFISDAASDKQPYLAPVGIDTAKWLYKRRIFAIGRVAPKLEGKPYGASVVPWQAVELRPKILGGDRDLIANDEHWAGIFRIIRAVSEVESLGYFDVVQAYDDANLSIPLFHYAVQKRTEAKDSTQLGGVSVWLNTGQNRPDKARHSFAELGLRTPAWCKWQDDVSTGREYDTGSGENSCSASSVTAPLIAPTTELPYKESLELHRRPHMMYRYAMHLRTLSSTRRALWQYAVHLLRQIVWLRIPGKPGVPADWANRPLGQVIQSERVLALILRIAVKNPGFVVTNFKKTPQEVFVASSAIWGNEKRHALLCWMMAAWETAKQDQAAFEVELVALLTGEHAYLENGTKTTIPDRASVDVSTLKSVATWPQANSRYHLNSAEVKTGLGSLSDNPGSSPFIEKVQGKRTFRDPLEPWWAPAQNPPSPAPRLDNRHPTPAHAPTYYTPQLLREAAKRMGIAPDLFAAGWKSVPDTLIEAQIAREVQAAAFCGYAHDANYVVGPTGHAHNLRSHDAFNQRWARLQLYEFDHRQRRSALLCTSATKLAGANIVWRLDEEAGITINAFDGRDGSTGGPIPVGKFNTRTAKAVSEGDSLASGLASTFDVPKSPLAKQAFEIFKVAVWDPDTQALPKVDSFSITIAKERLYVRFAWLKQTLGYEDKVAPAGDLGLYLQFLSWRLRDVVLPDAARDYLSATGFEFNQHEHKDRFFSIKTKPALDPWALAVAPRLWKPKAVPMSTTSSKEMAAALLTWPSLHRWRAMLRNSGLARRAMWDLWRVSFRQVLDVPVMGLGFDGKPRLFDLFQSEFALKAIALWAHVDAASLKKSLASAGFRQAIKNWLKTNVTLKNYKSWDISNEVVALDYLIDQLTDLNLETRLRNVRPGNTQVRQYQVDLESVFFLEALEGTEWPGAKSVAAATTGFIIAAPASRPFGIALLTEPAPAHPLVQVGAPGGSNHWVTGIAPIIEPGTPQQNLQGAALRFETPVEVTIKEGSTIQSVDLLGPSADSTELNVQLSAGDVTSGFMLEADVGSWLGPLGDDVKIILVAAAEVGDQSVDLKLGLRIEIPWLRRPIEYPLTTLLSINDIRFDRSTRAVEWSFGAAMQQLIERALPFRALFSDSYCSLRLGIDRNLAPFATLDASFKTLDIQLGSPIAALGLSPVTGNEQFSINADLTGDSTSVALTAPSSLSATLRMELAASVGTVTRVVPTQCCHQLLAPIVIELGTLDLSKDKAKAKAVRLPITLGVEGPRIPAWLFASTVSPGKDAQAFTLIDVSDQWFAGTAAQLKAALKEVSKSVTPASLNLKLLLDVHFEGEGWSGINADCTLTASCDIDNQGYLKLAANAFSFDASALNLHFTVPETAREPKFGEVAALKLPEILHAKLNLSGQGDTLAFNLSTQPIEITIPASGGYTFDVKTFGLGSAGATLEATVRNGNIKLNNLPTLSDSLSVHKASGDVGHLRVERGRLVSASISADARLKFFDDAEGTLTLSFFQQQTQQGVELGAMADFKVAMGRTFHVRALCLEVQVDSINLSLKYLESSWTATGGMTGSLAFDANGLLSGRLAEYSDLFDGTRAHFENLDLAKLGSASLKVWFTPRTFDLAGIFQITLRGMEIHKLGDLSLKSVGLLGDIAFKVEMPSLNCGLTMGDIRIKQPDIDAIVPSIKLMSLGVDIGLASGFQFKGSLTEFDDDQEYGFGGVASLESEAFPGTRVMVKLTRVLDPNKKQGPKPSFVVYADTDRTDSLGYGFFLRKLGLGAAGNQALKHFSTSEKRATPMAQRVESALREGIPYPGWPASWVADYPPGDDAYYSLVGVAQVTFGLLDRKTDHPFVTTLVLSIDDRLDIIAGISGWFLVSPDDALLDEFVSAPAVRGAIGLSPREQVLYGRFLTLPNSKFGPSVEKSIVAKMLHLALDSSRQSVAFYCDPRGTLLEIGYPRQARYSIDLGLAKGVAESGFRIGYYRGTHVVGLNLAIAAEVGMSFSGDLGFANVELSARAAFQLQASFAGALTSSGQMYVLADVAFSALLEISARIYKRIEVSGFWGSFSLTLFDLSASVRLTVTADVAAAIVPDGLGFSGTAEVALDICGYQFSARLRIVSNPERVSAARQQIDSLVPPISEIIKGAAQPVLASPTHMAEELAEKTDTRPWLRDSIGLKSVQAPGTQQNTKWCYHVRRVNGRTRVVLYPDPSQTGNGYPVLPKGETVNVRRHRIKLNPAGKDCLQGSVGYWPAYDTANKPDIYSIDELTAREVVPAKYLRGDAGNAGKNLLVAHLLQNLQTKPAKKIKEVVDPRTRHPVAGDFDDPAVLADPGRRSTRFRKRLSGSEEPQTTYDDYLAKARRPNTDAIGDAGKITDGELLASLLRLAESPDAEVGKEELPDVAGELNPLRFPAMLGLVLEFSDLSATETMADLITENGIGAFAEEIYMFGQRIEIADWRDPIGLNQNFFFEPDLSYWFQGQGEIGLSWQLTRVSNGIEMRDGPESHSGIRHFEVRREVLEGDLTSQTFTVLPNWLVWEDPADSAVCYYVRPQFQFIDSGLPVDRSLTLRYTIRAIGPIAGKSRDADGTLHTEVIDLVRYQPVRESLSLLQTQALLRMRLEGTPPQHAQLELCVLIDCEKLSGPSGTAPYEVAFQERLKVYRRTVPAGRVGTYGAGNETDISLQWHEELSGRGLRIPQPVQSRRMGKTALSDAEPITIDLFWKTVLVKTNEGRALVVLRAIQSFSLPNEDRFWTDLLIGGMDAAEFYIRLEAGDSDGEVLDMPTPFQRCRIAITDQIPPDVPIAKEVDPTQAMFSEGREVAALERFTANLPIRSREWASADDFRVQPDVQCQSGEDHNLRVRLVGLLSHLADSGSEKDKRFGPPVGYRIWMRDAIEDLENPKNPAPLQKVRSFSVLPEKVYRAVPQIVLPKTLSGAKAGSLALHSDWYCHPGKALRVHTVDIAPDDAPDESMARYFKKRTLHGGGEGAIHGAIDDFVTELGQRSSLWRVEISSDEPLYPPPTVEPFADRAALLLERSPKENDAFGWRLLEGLGCCATLWIEVDDDRLPIEKWAVGFKDAGVAIISFERRPRHERELHKDITLYGVRVFVMDILRLLRNAAEPGTGVLDRLFPATVSDKKSWTALHYALDWLKPLPPDATVWPDSWLALVREAAERSTGFIEFCPNSQIERLCARMWHFDGAYAAQPEEAAADGRVGPTDPPGNSTVVLPVIAGQVEFVHDLGIGYRRHLQIAVEVIRRYDFHAPQATNQGPKALALENRLRTVVIPRTLDLQPEVLNMAVNPVDGSVNAWVQVHCAQRAHLYNALARRVDFLKQTVELKRIQQTHCNQFAQLLKNNCEIDWEMLQASWESGSNESKPTASQIASIAQQDNPADYVRRGYDSFRYAYLPAAYAWYVEGNTQAGVRVSADQPIPVNAALPIEPMFCSKPGAGLEYRDLGFTWSFDGTSLELLIPFARALDALPQELRAYWMAADETYDPTLNMRGMPVLQTPDLVARYIVRAWNENESTSTDLVAVSFNVKPPHFEAQLLVSPYENAQPTATLYQFKSETNEAPWLGKLALKCSLSLAAPELHWLVRSLRGDMPGWILQVYIERDGIRYAMTEAS